MEVMGYADEIKPMQKSVTNLQNQVSGRYWSLQGSKKPLWLRGVALDLAKKQNLDQEKRGNSWHGEGREEKDQGGNEVDAAGADFICGGGWT